MISIFLNSKLVCLILFDQSAVPLGVSVWVFVISHLYFIFAFFCWFLYILKGPQNLVLWPSLYLYIVTKGHYVFLGSISNDEFCPYIYYEYWTLYPTLYSHFPQHVPLYNLLPRLWTSCKQIFSFIFCCLQHLELCSKEGAVIFSIIFLSCEVKTHSFPTPQDIVQQAPVHEDDIDFNIIMKAEILDSLGFYPKRQTAVSPCCNCYKRARDGLKRSWVKIIWHS